MDTSEGLVTYFREQASLDLAPRRMFGGVGLYLDGEMIAIVYDGRFFVKTLDKDAKRRHEEAGMGPFRPNSRQTLWSYWEIPPDVIDDRDELAIWLQPHTN